MSSQADILDVAGSVRAARAAFGLSPSCLAPYPFEQWQSAWRRLEDFQNSRQCLAVLVGNPGTGKSTMMETLARSLASDRKPVIRLPGAQLDGHEFLHLASISLGLNPNVYEKQALQAQLLAHLEAEATHREFYILVDDADLLGLSALSSLLRLANLPLLSPSGRPTTLADDSAWGEPEVELGPDAHEPALWAPERSIRHPGKSENRRRDALGDHSAPAGLRIVVAGSTRLLVALRHCLVDVDKDPRVGLATLGALANSEMHGYLVHCLARPREGAATEMSTGAADLIHRYSRGLPRVANRIAGRLLFQSLQSESHRIDTAEVIQVIDELGSEDLAETVPGGPDSGEAWEAPNDDPAVAEAPELPAATDKPAGAPWRRGARISAPAFALAVIVLTLAVGLRFWKEEGPFSDFASYLLARSDEPAASSGSTGLSPKPAVILPERLEEPPAGAPPRTTDPAIERQPPVNIYPAPANTDSTLAILPKRRDFPISVSPTTVDRTEVPAATLGATDRPEPRSTSVIEAPDTEPMRSGDLDTVQPSETAESPVEQNSPDRTDLALLSERPNPKDASSPPKGLLQDPRVRQLLGAAEFDLQNNRLTTPDGDNAYQRYRTVLEIEPGNDQALKGLEAIARSYLALIERARKDGDVERALAYLDRVDTVQPDFPETQRLRLQIAEELAADEDSPRTPMETGPSIPEQLVVLPPRTRPGCAWPFDRHMTDAVRDLIQRAEPRGAVLSASASVAAGDPGNRFWLGSSPNEEPDDQQVYRFGKRVGARWVLLSRIDCPNSASVYEPWRSFQVHLFDVERGAVHQQSGTLGDLALITEQVLLANIGVDGS